MLGTRTKQINAYGKRGRRVVDAAREANPPATNMEIISIFDDLPPPPEWKSLASKMKKRENTVPTKSNTLSTKVVGLHRKKRLSPVLSPLRKKQGSRMAQIMDAEISKPIASKTTISKAKPKPPTSGKSIDPAIFSESPPRAPLSAVPVNLPGSPSIYQPLPRIGHGTPLKQTKQFSPFVDVDIIVLDEDGQTVQKERRVSRTDVPTNTFNDIRRSKQSVKSPPSTIDMDSETQEISQPRRPKRLVTRKPIILSDSSSEDELLELKPKAKPLNKLQPRPSPSIPSSSQISLGPSCSALGVLDPPAPHRIRQFHALVRTPSPTFGAEKDLPSLPCIPKLVSPPQVPTRYHLVNSPILKPRQLTPIRGGRKRLFEPFPPPSPTTPSDLNLSIDFSSLSLDSESQTQGTYQSDFQIHDSLVPLLEECHQDACGPHNFSTFIESFQYDPILQAARENYAMDMKFRKIGEASYSEVFGIGDVVLKVIPLRDESNSIPHQDEEDGPAPTDAKDVRKEIIVTRAMGEVDGGFVKLLKTYVVRGRYPEVLLQLWDEYNEIKGSESVRPDTFKVSQVYAIIVLPNGGPDLEAYTFYSPSRTGWRQACCLFWQVAKALAHAEHLVSFEHRDLHWGQILVKNLPGKALKPLNMNHKSTKGRRIFMDDLSHGVEATIIDLGLSRMDAGDGGCGDNVHWTPFDEEVFMGEGDYQFDVYRIMKELTGAVWESFHPVTNVLWLHYLLRKLLYSKGIKAPAAPRKAKPLSPVAEASFSEKDCYDCLVDIENWLGKSIAELTPINPKMTLKGKGRRKTTALPIKVSAHSGPARAGEIVAYGVKKGWVQATKLT